MSKELGKQLESHLCNELKDVLYEVRDEEKTFRVSLDGIVIIESTQIGFHNDYEEEKKQWENEFILFARYWNARELSPSEASAMAEEEMRAQRVFDGCPHYLQCVESAETFLENTFEESLESSDYLILAFCLLDKRLRDQHLYDFEQDLDTWPQWLLDLYSLRVESMFAFD